MHLCTIVTCYINVLCIVLLYSKFHQFWNCIHLLVFFGIRQDVSMDGFKLRWGTSTCWRSNGDVWIYRCHNVEDGEEPTESRKQTKRKTCSFPGWLVLKVGFLGVGGTFWGWFVAWGAGMRFSFFLTKFVKGEDFLERCWFRISNDKKNLRDMKLQQIWHLSKSFMSFKCTMFDRSPEFHQKGWSYT